RRSPLWSRSLLRSARYFSSVIWFKGVSVMLSETNLSVAPGSGLFTAVKNFCASLPTFVSGKTTGSAKVWAEKTRTQDAMIERIVIFTPSQTREIFVRLHEVHRIHGPKG